MTEAMRDAVRSLCRSPECKYPECHTVWSPDVECSHAHNTADTALSAAEPHTAAAQAAAVAAAVLAEREACAELAERVIQQGEWSVYRWGDGPSIGASIRARSTQESGR